MELFKNWKFMGLMLALIALALGFVAVVMFGGRALFGGNIYDSTIANDEVARISVQNETEFADGHEGFTIVFHNMQDEGTLGVRVKNDTILVEDTEYKAVISGDPLPPGGADYRAIILVTEDTVNIGSVDTFNCELEVYDEAGAVVRAYPFVKGPTE